MGERKAACPSTEKDHQCTELVIDIPNCSEPALRPQYCIYKVPESLRKLNEEVYTPQLISIGPLHHDNKKLAKMEKHKLIYLREFCERTKLTWKDLVSILKRDEERVLCSYDEKSELCSIEYVNMILLDAVFIIELFKRNDEKKCGERQYDYILDNLWLKNDIQQDLLLLENQLPYFVLNNLYESTFPANKNLTFQDLTCNYFWNYKPNHIIIPDPMEVLHFTDLLRFFMANIYPISFPQSLCPFLRLEERKSIFSATKLHETGVEFKGIEKACLTDIDFLEGKLMMPRFEVHHNTERVIRNLMALEHCHYPYHAYICHCMFLMDFLVDNTMDVDLLVEKGVIINSIGSNEAVAEMVNKLCINIMVDSSFLYNDICQGLNTHYRSPYKRTMATLRSVYFANIWRGTSTVAAIILLVLTLIQTICSILALY